MDLYPIDFVKVAEACGVTGVRIDNPKNCGDQFKEALAMDGPVVIQCDTDPNEPPMPPEATKAEMKHLAQALVRGERDRGRISLTIGRQAMDEVLFPASDYGLPARIGKKISSKSEKDGE